MPGKLHLRNTLLQQVRQLRNIRHCIQWSIPLDYSLPRPKGWVNWRRAFHTLDGLLRRYERVAFKPLRRAAYRAAYRAGSNAALVDYAAARGAYADVDLTVLAARIAYADARLARIRAALRYRAAGDFTYLAGATSSTTLVYSGRILDWETWDIEYSSALVPLDGSQAAREYPGVNLNDSFVLLDPGYLYSATELKFFTTTPTPERTVLPATLAPGPGGNPIGYYHAIRVP